MLEWTTYVRLGKRMWRIDFQNGVTSSNGTLPATYETSNEIIQYAIENSPYFHSGRIKDITPPSWRTSRVIENRPPAESPAPSKPEEKDPAKEDKVYAEVRTLADAAKVLKGHGLPASSFRSIDAAKKTAAANGISFPNLV